MKSKAAFARGIVATGWMALALSTGVSLLLINPSYAQQEAPTVESSLDKLNRAAGIYLKHRRPDDAAYLAEQAVAMAEKSLGENDLRTAKSLSNLGEARADLGRLEEAERLHRRALAIRERLLPEDHPDIASSLHNLAWVVSSSGRIPEVERLYRRALAIREKSLPLDHPDIPLSLNNLAWALTVLNRTAEAEQLYRRSLALRERNLPENHPDLGRALNNLASVLSNLGRLSEAEPLHRRALAIYEEILPENHPDIAVSLSNLGSVLRGLNRLEEAEQALRGSLTIREQSSGPDSLDVAMGLNNLAEVLGALGRFEEAEKAHRRGLVIREKTLPKDHPDIAFSLNNLAWSLQDLGRYDEAEQLHRRALALRRDGLPENHPLIGDSLDSLAMLRGTYQGQHREALSLLDEAIKIRGATENRATVSKRDWRALSKLRVDYSSALRQAEGKQAADLFDTTRKAVFFDLQRERSGGAGSAIAAAMARAQADSGVAALARERDDMLSEIKRLDNTFIAVSSQGSINRDERGRQLALLRADADTYRQRLIALDDEIGRRFPAYSELAEAMPLTVSDLQPLLGPDEVLVAVTPHGDDGFLFAYGHAGGIFATLPEAGDAAALAKRLRCSAALTLDPTCREPRDFAETSATEGLAGANVVSRSVVSLRQSPVDDGAFDLDLAHDLYNRLFPTEVRSFLGGKKLIIAPAPELMGLPWHLLVTQAPPAGWNAADADLTKTYREAKWLFQSHPAITVLPTVASLRALRTAQGRNDADRAFLGLGDPTIGITSAERDAPPIDCGPSQPVRIASLEVGQAISRSAGSQPGALFAGSRDDEGFALADPELVRRQPRLADTRCELIAVARTIEENANDRTDVLLGEEATETRLRRLNDTGELARYRVLHFATHGLLGGELGLGEPGLVLTPPQAASAKDDGILTASEIATLTLSADWVVLSACNTAAGSEEDAEALSGMARSFFYAGARSLLVSSWPVYSSAAVDITTRAFGAMKADPSLGRAEALTLAMRSSLASARNEFTAHPSYWGPFLLVGEGAN